MEVNSDSRYEVSMFYHLRGGPLHQRSKNKEKRQQNKHPQAPSPELKTHENMDKCAYLFLICV